MYLLDHVGLAVLQGEAYGLSPCLRISSVAPREDLLRGGALIREACRVLISQKDTWLRPKCALAAREIAAQTR